MAVPGWWLNEDKVVDEVDVDDGHNERGDAITLVLLGFNFFKSL